MPTRRARDSTPPDLTTCLGPKFTLPHPVLTASGAFGYGDELAGLSDPAQLGALITPTLTLQARLGNPVPRSAEASAGLLHAAGLPNPGLEEFLTARLPGLRALPCPVIVSMLGETAQEWRQLAKALTAAGGLAAIELNLTPLQLLAPTSAVFPSEADLHARIREAVETVRAATALPIIAKLPPVGIEIGAAAQTAERAGADIIAVAQAFPGVAVSLSRRALRFPGAVGGLSGPCIKPLALYQVWRVAGCVALPILGAGGIMTGEDALEFFISGASSIAVGIANLIHPRAVARIVTDLSSYLIQHSLPGVQALKSRV